MLLHRRWPLFLLITFIVGSFTLRVAAQATPVEVLREDFEIGVFEDPAKRLIEDVWPRFLTRPWRQSFAGNLPKYMLAGLQSGGASSEVDGKAVTSRRYLRFAMRGGDAEVIGPDLALVPRMLLRVSADMKWDDLGQATVHVGLRLSESERVSLLVGSGKGREWHRLDGEYSLPGQIDLARLEIWIEGDRTRTHGEFGLDNVHVVVVPRVVLEWNGTLRRIEDTNVRPLTVRSVGFPSGEYTLVFIVYDVAGNEAYRERVPRLVTPDLPLDFSPQLHWHRAALRRGLYNVVIEVRSEQGWVLRDSREFALAGPPPFAVADAESRWGVDIDVLPSEPPAWLAVFPEARVLFRPEPVPPANSSLPDNNAPTPEASLGLDRLPAWLRDVGEFRRAAVLDPASGWSEARLDRLEPLFPYVHEWFWRAPAVDAAADSILAALGQRAPYVRLGLDLPKGERGVANGAADYVLFTPPDSAVGAPQQLVDLAFAPGQWAARIDLSSVPESEHAHVLATQLYLLAAHEPSSTYLANPSAIFFRTADGGGLIPTRALLAHEFVVAFLSRAHFLSFEKWDRKAICAVFERDGEQYLVVIGRGEDHVLELPAGDAGVAYDAVGIPARLEMANGLTRIPVGREPLLIAGLDMSRVRVAKSLVAASARIVSGGISQPIQIEMTNFYGEPVRASLALAMPKNWPGTLDIPVADVAAGERHEWKVSLPVPRWFGVEEATTMRGELELSFADGRKEVIPVELPMPIESALIEIIDQSQDGIARVRIKNLDESRLEIAVYLEIQPILIERRFDRELIAAGAERTYQIAYDPTKPDSRLLVSVVVYDFKSYVNKSFALP